ncbi:hypothetical protein F4861DRAFT_312330 [Xylaria intraflava]|nr:hypothetical protein F4861DRAFT_312330 [Xylaria intraflava]
MSSSPIINTLSRSSARVARRNGLTPTPRIPQQAKRTYAADGPPMSQGGRNRPFIIGALVAVPVLAYFLIPPRSEAGQTQGQVRRPDLDPAAKERSRKTQEPSGVGVKYVHPEHMHPEEFKPPFGQLHRPKRVDMPPDGRHHQSLTDRARRE